MPRLHYREILDRFSHIDADFVGCELGFPERRPWYRVRLYPWWEHPAYVEAIAEDARWGYGPGAELGKREVTVYPLGLVGFRITRRDTVTDWSFEEGGPRVWPHEPWGQLFVNGAIDRDALIGALEQRLGNRASDLATIVAPPAGAAWAAPLSLRLPRSVLRATEGILGERGVDCFVAEAPAEGTTPAAFVIDGDDYILADDFEVDVPAFEHRAEWFDPTLDPRGVD